MRADGATTANHQQEGRAFRRQLLAAILKRGDPGGHENDTCQPSSSHGT